jgi:Rps23 Pro-64 3,4-dihydroxylase Tpa1-like proline 4-hydroxylase
MEVPSPSIALPYDRFEGVLTEQVAAHLQEVGFVIIDNAFGEEWCQALRREIKLLYDDNLLYLNKTYYEGRREEGKFKFSYAISKPNIYELDLIDPSIRRKTPYFQKFYEDSFLRDHLTGLIPQVSLDCTDIKVQLNTGKGGCFPMHFDTSEEVSTRQITGTLYLNPHWTPQDGGHLRVYPFPYKHVDIEPIMDRLVLFSGHQTLHRVLPSTAERYCVTLWFSGSAAPGYCPCTFPWLKQIEGLSLLLNPVNRKSFAKVVYDKEWAQSVQESFGDSEHVEKVLQSHKKNVDTVKAQIGPTLALFLQENLPLNHDDNFHKYTTPLGHNPQ